MKPVTWDLGPGPLPLVSDHLDPGRHEVCNGDFTLVTALLSSRSLVSGQK